MGIEIKEFVGFFKKKKEHAIKKTKEQLAKDKEQTAKKKGEK